MHPLCVLWLLSLFLCVPTNAYGKLSPLCFSTIWSTSMQQAAHKSGRTVIGKSVTLDIEIGGGIYLDHRRNEYRTDCQVQSGSQKKLKILASYNKSYETFVGVWHTHGAPSSHTGFSKQDRLISKKLDIAVFLTIDRRTTRSLNPSDRL